MANRIPLIVNASASQIQEVPSGDVVNFDNKVVLTNSTASSSPTVGAVVVTGGVGIGGALNVDGNLDVDGTTQLDGLNVDGTTTLDATTVSGTLAATNATNSTNKTSGALVVTGGVGIGGALNVGGDITAFSTSDKNLKENLVPIPNAVDKVGIITGYTYKWKTAGTDHSAVDGEEDTGVIAQDVEVLGLPGITTTREDGTKAISYKRLTPLLIQAIKELDARLKILEG